MTPRGRAFAQGAMVGSAFASLIGNYPSVLIGYRAAPILGYGLALGLLMAKNKASES